MICDPSANNINIFPGPGTSLPGLGLPFSIPKVPFPDVALPEGIPEDILDLIERIFALFPQGIKFIPNADALTKGIWDVLASLFNQLAPFLAFYKFIQALLNIILCIIDVLCALLNPWATMRAVRRLFSRCLPDFLSLFPWLALLIMILALILLLIALIKYIIEVILAYIRQILRNLEILARALTVADEEAILAAVNKLAYLLCLIEQLFAILLAIAALFAIIRPLMDILGRSVCARGRDDCCTDDFCPSFIATGGLEGNKSATGQLIYFNRVEPVLPDDPIFEFLGNVSLPALRDEKWQFIDDDPVDFEFVEIITPSPEYGFIYWPEGDTYESNANVVNVPYLLDMNIMVDPAEFGNPSDTEGYRKFSIQNIIVRQKPTTSPSTWNNSTDTGITTGSLILVGGKVFESDENDGYTPYYIGSDQATLETFISRDTLYRNTLPTIDDGYYFLDVEYTFRYNYEVLVDKKIITMMCQPDLALESAVVNAEFSDTRSAFEKLGELPDIGTLTPDRTDGTGALGCLARSLTKFRKNINAESAAVFESESTACLNDLLAEAEDFYCRGVAETVDRFQTTIELDPDIQFIEHDIDVTVQLRDKTGTQLGVGVDANLGACLADLVTGEATFGELSTFEYDGYGDFVATISSDTAGTGELTVFVRQEPVADVINRDNDDVNSEIVTRVLPYEFIDKTIVYRGELSDDARTRFGPPDVAEDGE